MIYFIVYAILLFIYLFINNSSDEHRKKICTFDILILGLLSAFRFQNERSDFFFNYHRMIEVRDMSWDKVFHYSDEWLHQVIRKIISIIFEDPQAYFIITALFIVSVHLIIGKKYSEDISLFVLMYFSLFSYFSQNNITRQAVAVSITLLGWKYVIERKPLKYIFVIGIAALIHTSAIFTFPLYYLCSLKVNKNTVYTFGIASIITIIFSKQIITLGQKYIYRDYVGDAYGMTASSPIWLLLAFIVCAMILVYLKSSKIQNDGFVCKRKDGLIVYGAMLYVFCMVMSSIKLLLFARVAMYFSPCAILMIEKGLNSINDDNNRRQAKILLLLFMTIWFCLMDYNGKLCPTPYTPFWMFPDRIK